MSGGSPTKEKLAELSLRVTELHLDFTEAQAAFLKAAGWTHSSDHPDFRWRWSKEFSGRNYSLSTDEAVEFERSGLEAEGFNV